MINQNSKNNKDGLFTQDPVMKKSIILSEHIIYNDIFINANESGSHIRRKSNIKNSESREIQQSGIVYPDYSFISKKIKRIVNNHLLQVFQNIKLSKKCKIKPGFLQSRRAKDLASAFFSIKLYSKVQSEVKLKQLILSKSETKIISFSLLRLVILRQNQAFEKIKKMVLKRKQAQRLLLISSSRTLRSLIQFYQRKFMGKLQAFISSKSLKTEGAKVMLSIIQKLKKNQKSVAFLNILHTIQLQETEKLNNKKKGFTSKLNQNTSERARAFAHERELIKKLKSDLDDHSSIRTKTRNQIRKDINVQKTKLKDQQKKSKAKINELQSEASTLNSLLLEKEKTYKKRFEKLKSGVTRALVQNLYVTILNTCTNSHQQIKSSLIEKQLTKNWKGLIQKQDEYHLYKNQILKNQIYSYQSLSTLKSSWAQQDTAYEQNMNLKQLIKCLILRLMQNQANKNTLKFLER